MKKLGFFIEYIFFIFLKFICFAIGYENTIKLGRSLGKIIFKIMKSYRNYAFENTKTIFPNHSKIEKEEIIKKAFENVGITILSSFFLDKINKENFKNFVEFEEFEHVENALSFGKGLIVVTGHFGNWEFLAGVPSKLELVKLAIVMNRQVNPFTESMIVKTRQKANIKTIYNEPNEVKKLISFLKSNGVIGMVVDQAYYFDPILVNFFGKPAPTARGPAVFHLKLKAPIVMARSIFLENNKYKLKFYPPMIPKLKYSEKNIKKIMEDINRTLESWILELPEQWFSWIQPRWNVKGIIWHKHSILSETSHRKQTS